jgi:hypothetical protein
MHFARTAYAAARLRDHMLCKALQVSSNSRLQQLILLVVCTRLRVLCYLRLL